MWKKIIFEGKETDYSVSDIGEVRKDVTDYILKQQVQQGYHHVTIQINKKPKRFRVHRLVAEAFIPNPDNLPYVNHLDGNRANNIVSNLEWTTPAGNTQHAVKTGLMAPTREREVVQFSLSGEKIAEYRSQSEAARLTNSLGEKICMCCRFEREQHNGYQWRYKSEAGDKIQPVAEYRTKKKRVAQIEPSSGQVIAIYDSIANAARAVNGTGSAISNIINHKKQTKTHKGYEWKVVDDIVH